MKNAKHLDSGKIISAEDATYNKFYGIFLCPECKETLTLRKGYFRDGVKISSTFIHPSLDNKESCSQRKTWGIEDNSFDGKLLSQGQLRSLLQKNLVDAVCHYYLWWNGNHNTFNYIGKTDLHGLNITQARTKITKFFKTEGQLTKQDCDEFKFDSYVKRQIQSKTKIIKLFKTGEQLTEQNYDDELNNYIKQQMTEPRLKDLAKFIEVSEMILGVSNNLKFVQQNISKIKNQAFSSLNKNNPLLEKHFNLVGEVASFLFSNVRQDLICNLAPYFITFPYQRALQDTNSHWKGYKCCLKQVEEIFGSSSSKVNQFYYLFYHNDSSQYSDTSKYISYLLLNVVNILVYTDWISWFAKWQS